MIPNPHNVIQLYGQINCINYTQINHDFAVKVGFIISAFLLLRPKYDLMNINSREDINMGQAILFSFGKKFEHNTKLAGMKRVSEASKDDIVSGVYLDVSR